jgi:hypothetical protein
MKRTILAAVLGVAGLAVSSYGQGYINFGNYTAVPYYAVVYNSSVGPRAGTQVSSEASVELGWANGAGVTSGFTMIPSSTTAILATQLAQDNGSGPFITGWFQGPTVTLTGYTLGAVTFEILGWDSTGPQGGTSATSQYQGKLIWTEPASAIATGLSAPGSFTAMTGDIVLNYVPEPTTLALGILGGLSLLAFRRKQA